MKKALLSLSFILLSFFVFSQEVLVQHNSKGAYVVHTVRPKDNFYSIGRAYAIAPKEIATFNALDMNKGLEIGQQVMIPLTAANFSQTKATGTPVYYVVGEKEGLYRVSTNNGKVLMASLRKWNHLTKDNISTGQKLIVGYLQATEPANAVTIVKPDAPAQVPMKEPLPKKVEPAKEAEQPVTQKEETKKETKTTTPQDSKPAPQPPSKATTATGAGYFKNQYDQQSKDHNGKYDATVTSGIFKTTSGWQDAKYYALMDKVDPGTIVQVVNPANNKSVYAKVLGEMSGIRQNQGLELRISNAAATALDIAEPDKFIVRVLY